MKMKWGDTLGRFLTIIVATSLISALLTYLLYLAFKRFKFVKYILGFIFILIAIYSYYQGKIATEGFKDIANFIIAIIFAVAAATNLLFSFFIDYKYKV